jgi:hypothetical protein
MIKRVLAIILLIAFAVPITAYAGPTGGDGQGSNASGQEGSNGQGSNGQ